MWASESVTNVNWKNHVIRTFLINPLVHIRQKERKIALEIYRSKNYKHACVKGYQFIRWVLIVSSAALITVSYRMMLHISKRKRVTTKYVLLWLWPLTKYISCHRHFTTFNNQHKIYDTIFCAVFSWLHCKNHSKSQTLSTSLVEFL